MAAILIGSLVAFGPPAPNFRGLPALPWWGWLGGFAGATYVTTVFTAIPVIGASATIGLTVAGQQIAAVFVDKFAWFRLPQRAVSTIRLIGVAILLAGVAVIKVAWALAMKKAHGFSEPVWTTVSLVLLAAFVILLTKALQVLPVGTAYAVWTGIGAAGTVCAGILLFSEPVSAVRLIFVAIIVAGIVGLNLSSN